MTARRRAGALWGGLLSVVASGCGGASPAAPVPVAPRPPRAQQPARPPRTGEVMLLTGENDFRAAAWLASGMLVASTGRALWFLHADKPDEATLVERQPGGPHYFGPIVTARDQDVFALYSEDGTLWLHRGTQPLGSIVIPSLAEVRLSHDGKLALAGESVDGDAGQTWLIDVDTQKEITKLAGVDGRFSTDGNRVLTDAGRS